MNRIKIIGSWNPKGGQGKSLFALNCGAAAVELGLRVLVADMDQQGTSLLYGREGSVPFDVVGGIPKSRPENIDLMIIDYQAADWKVPSEPSVLIIPVKPVRDQYNAYLDAKKRAEAAGKIVIPVVTDIHGNRPDEIEVRDVLLKEGALPVMSGACFGKAAASYITIFDESLNRVYKIKDRRKEISAIMGKALLAHDTEDSGQQVSHNENTESAERVPENV